MIKITTDAWKLKEQELWEPYSHKSDQQEYNQAKKRRMNIFYASQTLTSHSWGRSFGWGVAGGRRSEHSIVDGGDCHHLLAVNLLFSSLLHEFQIGLNARNLKNEWSTKKREKKRREREREREREFSLCSNRLHRKENNATSNRVQDMDCTLIKCDFLAGSEIGIELSFVATSGFIARSTALQTKLNAQLAKKGGQYFPEKHVHNDNHCHGSNHHHGVWMRINMIYRDLLTAGCQKKPPIMRNIAH